MRFTHILPLITLLLVSQAPSQTRDTLGFDIGKEGGFLRIRDLYANGKIRRVWTTEWRESEIKKSYTEYDAKGKRTFNIDSTFTWLGDLRALARKIGDSIEGEEVIFDSDGNIAERSISIHHNGKYVIYIYEADSAIPYRAVIDGDPPRHTKINASDFLEAEQIFNDRMFKSLLAK